jgi:hypothetical protein
VRWAVGILSGVSRVRAGTAVNQYSAGQSRKNLVALLHDCVPSQQKSRLGVRWAAEFGYGPV